MVEHGNDQKLIAQNAIDHRKRKPAKQYPAAVASHEREHRGVARGRCDCSIQSPCKFKTETCSAGLIPSLCLKRLVSGLGPEEDMHLLIALEQFSANLIPWHCACRILVMFFQPDLHYLSLVRGQAYGLLAFRGDAVPDIFRQLDSFSDGKLEEVGSGLAHGGSICRCLCAS